MTRLPGFERFGLGVVLLGLVVCLLAFLSYVFFPASYWYEVDHLSVPNVRSGEMPIVIMERNIHRDFEGVWQVGIWRAGRGGWISQCSTHPHEHDYRTDEVDPDPMPLDWYVGYDAACYDLPPGIYRMDTKWQVNPHGLFRREVSVTDVIFEVTE